MASTVAPRLSGRARVGSKLSTDGGTWSQSGVSLSYRWFRSGKPVRGATTRVYYLRKADIGHRLLARVIAVKDGYTTVTARSPRSKVVARRR
jgi:hypothetical protein